jgi:hypothetical protein
MTDPELRHWTEKRKVENQERERFATWLLKRIFATVAVATFVLMLVILAFWIMGDPPA